MADEQELNPQTPEPVQHTEIELRAMNEGWVPQDEWAGDPDQWRPAKEFLDRGELFKKIDEQKRELKHMRSAIDELGRHHAQVKAIAYKEALATLRAQKKEALEAGDADMVVEIDDRIAETREAQRAAENAPQQQVEQPTTPPPEFVRWQAKNQWYSTDRAMKVFADDIAREMVGRGFSDASAILNEVDRQVRKEFPQKFENPKRAGAAAVEGNAAPKGRATRDDVVMSDAEKAIMKRIVSTGVITKEKYLEEYKARQGG